MRQDLGRSLLTSPILQATTRKPSQ